MIANLQSNMGTELRKRNYYDSEDDDDPLEDRAKNAAKIKDFEDKVIDASYAVSPLKPLTHFLNLGTLIGVFPADSGDRKIRFALTFSLKLIWAIIFTICWLGFGAGVAAYCCIYNATLSTAFYVSFFFKDQSGTSEPHQITPYNF